MSATTQAHVLPTEALGARAIPRHLSGRALREGTGIPVTVGPASRISLCVSFTGGEEPPDQTVFGALQLEVPERGAAEFSACRFVSEPAREGWAGRLVFLQDVYDFEKLFSDGSVTNLRAYFANIPLVLQQKVGVKAGFKDFVADAVYDFSVYKRYFDEQDRILAGEPPHVAHAAREAILETEGGRFFAFFDRHLAQLEEATRSFSREEHERHAFYLRRMVWPYILGSAFLRHTNLKPRGYAGDATLMQMAYENRYVGSFIFNQLLHKHPLQTDAAEAVRNRRRLVPEVMREVLQGFPRVGSHGFRILSVACGPAWELQDLFLAADDFERFHCTLLDQDAEALDLAREGIRRIEGARGIRISADFLPESVRTMLRIRDLAGRYGRYHFVYSMGLFDYLTTPVARAVLTRLWELVLPGGTLLVGNYHVRNPTRIYMDYWMDWPLIYRTEESFLELAAGLPAARPSVSFDETGCQMFLRLEKP